MMIMKNRNQKDFASLNCDYWSGMLLGDHEYPTINQFGLYFIQGGENGYFRATHVEFYGINMK